MNLFIFAFNIHFIFCICFDCDVYILENCLFNNVTCSRHEVRHYVITLFLLMEKLSFVFNQSACAVHEKGKELQN